MTKEELEKSLNFVNEERERLQKENEELKKIKETFANEGVIFFISDLIDERNGYKNKINKAIEYIEPKVINEYIHTDYIYKLLDILRGEDK